MDCGLPGSSVHGIFQGRVLEWVTVPFSRGSSQTRDWTQVSHIAGGLFYCLSHQGSPRRSEPSHNNGHPIPGGKCPVLLHTPLAWWCSSEASFLPLGSEFTCSKVICKNIFAGRREVVGALYPARDGCFSSTLVSGLGVNFQKLPIWMHSKTYGLACCSVFKSLIDKYNGRCRQWFSTLAAQ